MASYRKHLELEWGVVVPDDIVITDTEDSFSYRADNGLIVGFNKCVETWWRNMKIVKEHDDAKGLEQERSRDTD
jgi:hypothetical protein